MLVYENWNYNHNVSEEAKVQEQVMTRGKIDTSVKQDKTRTSKNTHRCVTP